MALSVAVILVPFFNLRPDIAHKSAVYERAACRTPPEEEFGHPICNRPLVALDITLCGNPEMTMATSYSIGKHFEAFIESLIATGRYSTASEIIRDGLRLIEEREQSREAKLEALRAAIQEGLDSPSEEVDIDEMIEDVKRRGRERLAAERDGKQGTRTEAGQS
jgi:antitoxin ParD1/3/4